MRRALIAGVAALAVAAAVVWAVALRDGDDAGYRYDIVFDNGFGLVEGADFKVAGVRVGQIETLELSEGFPPRAVVGVKAEGAGARAFRRDARCEVRPQSLIGEYFVDCRPGSAEQRIPDGGTVPVEQTSSTIPLDVVNNTLRRPYRERLRIIVATLGAGLAGRPDDLSAALRRAHPGLRETTQTLRILGRQEDILERFIADSDTVLQELEGNKEDVARFVREARNTAEVSASRRGDIAASLDRLPPFLTELEPTMERLGELADSQIPTLRNFRRAAPDLRRTFNELVPFASSAKPALDALGDVGRVGSRAFDESADEIAELEDLARETPEAAEPLRQFLDSIDDRDRSTEADARAAESAPPAPDKTADARGKGFTGMESLLNYAYWQTLAINGFDQVSHVLRFTGIVNECTPYQADPSEAIIEDCNAWLGPDQPGVTTPDPTADGGAARSSGRRDASKPRRGRSDPSSPPSPQQLLELLGRDAGKDASTSRSKKDRTAGRSSGGGPVQRKAAEPLLDFLLAP